MRLILFLLFTLVCFCWPYKILVVNPKAGYSHMNFLGKIADTLVDAGHEVVTLQPLIVPFTSNGTSKSRLIQVHIDEELSSEILSSHQQNQKPIWTSSAANPARVIRAVPRIRRVVATSVRRILDESRLLNQLKNEKFDLGIVELFDFIGIPVFEAIGLKNIIGAHSTACVMEGTSLSIGAPVIPSFMPASLGISDDSTSLTNRAVNILFTALSWYFQTNLASAAEKAMVEKLGPTAPPIWDIVSNISFVLTNIEPLLDYAKPTLHKFVDIGGIGVHKPKPLDEKWSNILNVRKQAVLMSFGSMAQSKFMPSTMKESLVDVIKSFPNVTFIWKYEDPDFAPFAVGVKNLILSKWTPQNDLLADDRVSLFITHAGAGSLLESAHRGKPLIVVPLFGDQIRNAKLAVKYGFALMLSKADLLDRDVMRNAVGNVLDDEKYRKAAHRIRNLLAKRPFPAELELVKTVELAAEFGEMPELRVAGRKLGVIAYYNLDLILLLLFVSAASVSFLILLIYRLFAIIPLSVKVKAE